MSPYSDLQLEEFAAEELGYRGVTRQRFPVVAFLMKLPVISGGNPFALTLGESAETNTIPRI